MGLSQLFRLSIEGLGVTWRVLRVTGRERIHAPFVFEVTCAPRSGDEPPSAEALVTQAARLAWDTIGGDEHVVLGIVDRVEVEHAGYCLKIVPSIAVLEDCIDHRVCLDKDAATIAEEILREHGIGVDRRLARPLAARAQCVQAFESDLAFVSRLLAEEGIAWWIEPGTTDSIVLADHPSGYEDIPGDSKLRVTEGAGLLGAEAVSGVRLRSQVVSNKVSTRDYDFEKPELDQSADAIEGDGALEVYSYPGGYADPGLGRALARNRLEAARAGRVVLHGESSCRRLSAGRVITLVGAAREDVNRRWLLVEVEHEARDHEAADGGARYVARITAVPADAGYRPPHPKPPHVGGVQTATIAGPAGAELHTEAHGRVVSKLRWDRRAACDERSSHWTRVMHPPMSGSFFLPRTGWEVLLGFSGASADAPVVLGRLNNGEALPPEGLPNRKVVSAFGSLTTPKGVSSNVIRMDDSAGNESLGFGASNDYNERTENDKVTGVMATDGYAIGASRTLIVGQVHQVGVTGAQSYTVGGRREVNVDANKQISAASESVSIGGARVLTIGGDLMTAAGGSLARVVGAAKAEAPIEHLNRTVTGGATVTVGGSWIVTAGPHASVTVLGASNEEVGGMKNVVCGKYKLAVTGALAETMASRSVQAGADRAEGFGAAASYSVAAAAKVSGSDVVFKAKSKITLKASGATIVITPSSITIEADFKGSVPSEDQGNESYG